MRYLFSALLIVCLSLSAPAYAADGCSQTGGPGCGGCPCQSCVCGMDSYCCSISWDSLCVDECISYCGGCTLCGNGSCDPSEAENCDSCPEDCGCAGGEVCNGGVCCTPQCEGLECGDNGCGGVCGDCPGGTCFGGTCCFPQCAGKECGDDGCGGSCGDCPPYDKCVNGTCELCVPDCIDRNCGTDGCGGSCGECEFGEFCPGNGVCEDLPRCEPATTLPCEAVFTDSTLNGTSIFQAYNCAGGQKKGDEVAYAFLAEEDDVITVKLTELDGPVDLGIYLVGDPCISDNCLATDSKKLTAEVIAGNTYYIVIDGAAGAPTSYELEVQCLSQCVTECAGKTCGPDGCGGTCGTCQEPQVCALGNCQEYGGFGWPCLGDFECDSGFCGQGPQAKVCTQECGSCPAGWSCEAVTVNGDSVDLCVSDCLPDCQGNECGDNGCGYPCGVCAKGFLCEEDLCVEAPCEPNCIGKECGEDGCGGDCGTCVEGFDCKGSTCVEIPCEVDCNGVECGPSNCPGKGCGECTDDLFCTEGLCVEPPCVPQCEKLECGPDGCEGLCGECSGGYQCVEGLCALPPQPEGAADVSTVDSAEVTGTYPDSEADVVTDPGGGSDSSCSASNRAASNALMVMLVLLSGLIGLRLSRRAPLRSNGPNHA